MHPDTSLPSYVVAPPSCRVRDASQAGPRVDERGKSARSDRLFFNLSIMLLSQWQLHHGTNYGGVFSTGMPVTSAQAAVPCRCLTGIRYSDPTVSQKVGTSLTLAVQLRLTWHARASAAPCSAGLEENTRLKATECDQIARFPISGFYCNGFGLKVSKTFQARVARRHVVLVLACQTLAELSKTQSTQEKQEPARGGSTSLCDTQVHCVSLRQGERRVGAVPGSAGGPCAPGKHVHLLAPLAAALPFQRML